MHSQELACRAARLVRVTYQDLPTILTIEDAIAAKAFISNKTITNGDVTKGMASSAHVLEGTARMGGQEHFYFETQACVCYPKPEKGEMEVFSSTQAPSHTQHAVAGILGVDSNKVVCRVKRLGGGFGGKETRYGCLFCYSF